MQRRVKTYQKEVHTLREQITAANTEIATRESELEQERQIKQDLFQQASNAAQSLDSERMLFLKIYNRHCYTFG